MTIKFFCFACGKRIEASDSDAGEIGRCSCGARVEVPLAALSESAVDAAPSASAREDGSVAGICGFCGRTVADGKALCQACRPGVHRSDAAKPREKPTAQGIRGVSRIVIAAVSAALLLLVSVVVLARRQADRLEIEQLETKRRKQTEVEQQEAARAKQLARETRAKEQRILEATREETRVREFLAQEADVWLAEAGSWLAREQLEAGEEGEWIDWQKFRGFITETGSRWRSAPVENMEEAQDLGRLSRSEWEKLKRTIGELARKWVRISWRIDYDILKEHQRAGTGNAIRAILVEVENHGYDEVPVNPFYFALEMDGVEYHPAFAILDPKLQSVRLKDGGRTRGGIAFEVSADGQ